MTVHAVHLWRASSHWAGWHGSQKSGVVLLFIFILSPKWMTVYNVKTMTRNGWSTHKLTQKPLLWIWTTPFPRYMISLLAWFVTYLFNFPFCMMKLISALHDHDRFILMCIFVRFFFSLTHTVYKEFRLSHLVHLHFTASVVGINHCQSLIRWQQILEKLWNLFLFVSNKLCKVLTLFSTPVRSFHTTM